MISGWQSIQANYIALVIHACLSALGGTRGGPGPGRAQGNDILFDKHELHTQLPHTHTHNLFITI